MFSVLDLQFSALFHFASMNIIKYKGGGVHSFV